MSDLDEYEPPIDDIERYIFELTPQQRTELALAKEEQHTAREEAIQKTNRQNARMRFFEKMVTDRYGGKAPFYALLWLILGSIAAICILFTVNYITDSGPPSADKTALERCMDEGLRNTENDARAEVIRACHEVTN